MDSRSQIERSESSDSSARCVLHFFAPSSLNDGERKSRIEYFLFDAARSESRCYWYSSFTVSPFATSDSNPLSLVSQHRNQAAGFFRSSIAFPGSFLPSVIALVLMVSVKGVAEAELAVARTMFLVTQSMFFIYKDL